MKAVNILEEQRKLSEMNYKKKKTFMTEKPKKNFEIESNRTASNLTKYQLPYIDDLIQGLKTPSNRHQGFD